MFYNKNIMHRKFQEEHVPHWLSLPGGGLMLGSSNMGGNVSLPTFVPWLLHTVFTMCVHCISPVKASMNKNRRKYTEVTEKVFGIMKASGAGHPWPVLDIEIWKIKQKKILSYFTCGNPCPSHPTHLWAASLIWAINSGTNNGESAAGWAWCWQRENLGTHWN